MTTLTGDERRQHAAYTEAWTNAIESRSALPEGYEYRLRAEPPVLTALMGFVAMERRCCPFFTFSIRVDAGPKVSFRMTGPPGTREFIESQ